MKTLDVSRIEELAQAKGAKSVAVENFLTSLDADDTSYKDASDNLKMDARLYRWNAATVKAIRTGIGELFA